MKEACPWARFSLACIRLFDLKLHIKSSVAQVDFFYLGHDDLSRIFYGQACSQKILFSMVAILATVENYISNP